MPVITSAATFSNFAEASQTQNRLLQILQQRMQASADDARDMHVPYDHGFMSSLQAAAMQAKQSSSFASGTPHSASGSGVLSAINTMMQTNQQLIAMLQETERTLAAAQSTPPPPHSPFAPRPEDLTAQLQQVNGKNTWSSLHRYAAVRDQGFTAADQAVSHHIGKFSYPTPGLDVSASDDPAVLQLQRRKSVTFENLAKSTHTEQRPIDSSSQPSQQAPSARRPVHALPPRPMGLEVSERLLGVVPTNTAYSGSLAPVSLPAAMHDLKLADSTSTMTPSEADVQRQNRSNAPSPEDFTRNKPSVIRNMPAKALSAVGASKIAQAKHNRSPQPSKAQRQPLADKSGNLSVSSSNSGRGKQTYRQRFTGKENAEQQSEQTRRVEKIGKQRRAAAAKRPGVDETKWTSFVREMGGSTQVSSTT